MCTLGRVYVQYFDLAFAFPEDALKIYLFTSRQD